MASTTTERNPLQESAFAAMAAKILYAAAELELPELLAAGPMTSAELADRTDAHAPSLRRLLRALAGLGVVDQPDTDRFELTALGGSLRAEAPDSIHAVLTMLCGPENWRSWGELVAGVRSGEAPWELVHGVSWLEYYEQNPKRAANFNRAMAEHTRAAAVPEGADASLLKQVLHDWDDEHAATILRNVRRSMASGGRVLMIERMLPEIVGEADAPTLLLDVLMMTVTGGRERTLREFQDLFAAAGLELAAVTEPIPPFDYRVLEARAPVP